MLIFRSIDNVGDRLSVFNVFVLFTLYEPHTYCKFNCKPFKYFILGKQKNKKNCFEKCKNFHLIFFFRFNFS